MSDAEGMAFEANGAITLAGGSFLVNTLDDSRTQFTLARIQATGPACANDDDCPLCQSCDGNVCTQAPRSSCAAPHAARIKWQVYPNQPGRDAPRVPLRGTRRWGRSIRSGVTTRPCASTSAMRQPTGA